MILEVVSPDTYRYDWHVKRPDYMSIHKVREIVSIDSDAMFAEILRREGEHWFTQFVREPDHTIFLASVGIEISMSELYEGFVFPEEEAVPGP